MTFYTALAAGMMLTLWLTCSLTEASDTVPPFAPTQKQEPAPQNHLSTSHFMAVHDFSHFTATTTPEGKLVLLSPVFSAPLDWDELVVSWNAQLPPASSLQVEACGIYPDHTTKYYTMGIWSDDPARHPRTSVSGQHDTDGTVNTDTLVLKRPNAQVQIRLTLGYDPATGTAAPQAAATAQAAGVKTVGAATSSVSTPQTETATPPQSMDNLRQSLKFMGLCFCNGKAKNEPLEPNRAAWGKVIPVPERSQVSYQGGEGWCSPTSVSMDLAHWSKVLNRPELNKDVPEVARSVYDQTWGGTGNWPFNTAFAGSFPGVRAYVTRFSDVSEIEDWIAAGIPVILSVSYDLLKGKAESQDAGHLIVGVGFTEQGDIIVNDPWARLEKGETVRKTFSRRNLIAGWGNSHNTVYLVYPETAKIPQNRLGHWDGD
ncbi:MAG: C39 family peptidase [Abitibacteriaceae bacterium]|nr:C39 family peptidase [Abditibacteriaceae bacterium]